MTEYLVRRSSDGEPLVILEAADPTDAELYANRNLKDVGRIVALDMTSTDAHEASLKESFTTIMGDEKLAEVAAKGRDTGQSGPRRIIVPRQLAGGGHEELTEAQRDHGRESLEESFRQMGFSESAAKIAAQGRN